MIRLIPAVAVAATPPDPSHRFLSEADCEALKQQLLSYAHGGGQTNAIIDSTWTGNLQWARNEISSSGDVRGNNVGIQRTIRGSYEPVWINAIDAHSLERAVRRSEYLLRYRAEGFDLDFYADNFRELHLHPAIWFDTTFNLDAARRASVMRELVQPAVRAGMHAAGYLQVGATGRAVMSSWASTRYYPFTQAQYSVTVRDPRGVGSGWAGVDWSDWSRVDAARLSAIALDKCLRSRNPVALEPGRHTAILEPQAVCDLVSPLINQLDRASAERGFGPFAGPTPGTSKIGERLLDERITLSADPMDPDLGFPPFDVTGASVYYPAVWFERGVLKDLSYSRSYAMSVLGRDRGLPNSGAYRMTGGTTTIEEMIATTKRGLLVTRFTGVGVEDQRSMITTGYTRDGLWLIENGTISKPIKNFWFRESPLFVLNQVEQLGVPQRVFHPRIPVLVPPIKVRDFNFSRLTDAV